MKRKLTQQFALSIMAASVALTYSLTARADPALDAGAKQVEAAAADAVNVIASVRDAASAKAAKPQLDAAMAKFRAADTAFNVTLAKANPKSQQESDDMDKAVASYQKANQALADTQLKVLNSKDVGEVLGRSFNAPGSKENLIKTNTQ